VNAQTATPARPEPAPELRAANAPYLAEAIHARSGWDALLAGLRRGFHPQSLCAWVALLWLPTLVAALPAAIWLYLQAGHSPHAAAIAASAAFLADVLEVMRGEGVFLALGAGFALVLALLLSPWLSGMVVARIRTGARLSLRGVLRAGLGEYPRMLRMLAGSLLLLALALAIGVAAMLSIESLVLRFAGSDADLAPTRAGWFLPALLVLLVHVTVEAGRGCLGADPALRSVTTAWKRGASLLLQRPGATMLVYLGTCLAGNGLALVFLRLRMLIDMDGWSEWLLAWACAQFAVAAMAWGRSARLHALAELATAPALAPGATTAAPQHRADAGPAG
jgi:hypothetical protein